MIPKLCPITDLCKLDFSNGVEMVVARLYEYVGAAANCSTIVRKLMMSLVVVLALVLMILLPSASLAH